MPSVGKSSYGALKDIEQFVNSQAIADQFNSLAYEFDTEVAKNGDRLSVNEANRSRPRQKQLRDEWDAYVARGKRPPVAFLAAVTYTSTHDDVNYGNAFDIGKTDKNGNYQVPTDGEWAWIHARAYSRGIRHTGASFNPREEWHHNGGYAATLAPIPNVRVANTPIPVAPVVTAEYFPDWNDDVMIRLVGHPATEPTTGGTGKGGWFLHNIENGKKAYIADGKIVERVKRVLWPVKDDQMLQIELDEVTALVKAVL